MVHAAEFFGGAALGSPFGKALDLIEEAIRKCVQYAPLKSGLESRAKFLKSLLVKIEDQNTKLNPPQQSAGTAGAPHTTIQVVDEETKHLNEEIDACLALLRELSDPSLLKSCLTPYYTGKLVEFDDSLKSLIGVLQVQGIVDVKKTLVWTKETTDKLDVCKSEVNATFVLVRKHMVELDDCNSHVKEISAWTGKTSDQLDQMDSNGKEALRKMDTVASALDRIERTCVVQDEKVASLLEGVALKPELGALSDVVDQAFRKPDISFFSSPFERIGNLTRWLLLEQCFPPFTEEIPFMHIPLYELQTFRVQVEEGTKLVRKIANVWEWTDNKKAKYGAKLLDLEKSLQAFAVRLNGNIPLDFENLNFSLERNEEKQILQKSVRSSSGLF